MTKEVSIMLIDDNSSANLYHSIMIKEAGISEDTIKKFTSSDVAIQNLWELKNSGQIDELPDTILIDINMPGINGWDCVDEIVKIKSHIDWSPSIYMVSNSQHPSDLAKAESHPHITDIKEKHLEKEFFESLMHS